MTCVQRLMLALEGQRDQKPGIIEVDGHDRRSRDSRQENEMCPLSLIR